MPYMSIMSADENFEITLEDATNGGFGGFVSPCPFPESSEFVGWDYGDMACTHSEEEHAPMSSSAASSTVTDMLDVPTVTVADPTSSTSATTDGDPMAIDADAGVLDGVDHLPKHTPVALAERKVRMGGMVIIDA